jgi:hypothetical protein
MQSRNLMVIALREELLGPRGGAFEHIDTDPRSKYLVGVLEPKDYVRGAFAFYGRPDIQTIEAGVGEDDDVVSEVEPTELSFQLDPRALPKTMGISFIVDGKAAPFIALCATWARYLRSEQGWTRKPSKFVKHDIDVRKNGSLYENEDIRISLTTAKTSQGHYHVSIYFVNETPLPERGYPRTEDHIFQPHLRIVCEEGARLSPIIGEEEEDPEESSLSLLYRNRAAMARGHLCGATWKSVDPERPPMQSRNRYSKDNPFIWIDREIIPEPDRSLFTTPDVRTEYLPCYPIEQVKMKPPEEASLRELKAEVLSDVWDVKDIVTFLDPIPKAYSLWIEKQTSLASNLEQRYRKAAERHLDLCRTSEHRIKEGISLLRNDHDVRLAFCFMNKVINTQSIWKTGKPLVWRLFQIAFILQCIPSIAQDNHSDRLMCDLLWFPTGSGKTEAYLGLSRRRDRSKETNGAGTGVLSRYTLRMLTIQQFRRALFAITACDYLRVKDWRPKGYTENEKELWGKARFSIGLWVGQDVTPNRLVDHKGWDSFQNRPVRYPGAVSS